MKLKLYLALIISNCISWHINIYPDSCSEKHIKLLEQQLEKQNQIIENQQKTFELQTLQLQIEKIKLEAQLEEENKQKLVLALEADKAWYQKTWETISPILQRAILNYIISTTISKVINAGVDGLDYATGDLPAKNGYEKWAIYLGTFVASESLRQYQDKRDNKIINSSEEVQKYDIILKDFKTKNLSAIQKGYITRDGLELAKLALLGDKADEFLERLKEKQNKEQTAQKNNAQLGNTNN